MARYYPLKLFRSENMQNLRCMSVEQQYLRSILPLSSIAAYILASYSRVDMNIDCRLLQRNEHVANFCP